MNSNKSVFGYFVIEERMHELFDFVGEDMIEIKTLADIYYHFGVDPANYDIIINKSCLQGEWGYEIYFKERVAYDTKRID